MHHDERIWHPQVIRISALRGQGVADFWAQVQTFSRLQQDSGRWQHKRQQQARAWMWERIDAGLREAFRQHAAVRQKLPALSDAVLQGRQVPSAAARELLAVFLRAQEPAC